MTGLLSVLIPKAQASISTWMLPEQASTFAEEVDLIFDVINWLNLFFFILIIGPMFYFAIVYRRRSEDQRTSAIQGSHTIELLWSTVPSIGLVVIFWMGFVSWMDMNVPPNDPDMVQIRVTGQKWAWSYQYTDPASGKAVDTNKLVVPKDRPVSLVMNSVDVLHSFFIPAFRVKKDVVPNRYTQIWFEATKTGTYDVFCTEYCGTDHSRMLSKAKVLEAEEFDAWLTEQGEAAEKLASMSPAEQGEALFNGKLACNACHSIDGSAKVGPTLKGLYGKDESLDDGSTVKADDNYIRESIVAPQAKIVAGYPPSMPPFAGRVDDAELNALIDYIKTLE